MTKTSKDQLKEFQQDYPFLSFEEFDTHENDEFFEARFHFNLSDKITFLPSFKIIKNSYYKNQIQAHDPHIANLIFHVGLIEMMSYWKATCSPKIYIKAFAINDDQAAWLKDLYYKGLGEFFYLNKLDVDPDNFVEFISTGKTVLPKIDFTPDGVGTIVPVGGGKDSVVTVEIVKKSQPNVIPFVLNSSATVNKVVEAGGFSDHFSIKRHLDPQLFDLNAKGFFNGHTPFSALLSFYTLLVAKVSGVGNIALSNESSANEPTVIGTHVNHQYSKSFEYEKNFRDYTRKYIGEGYNYFSFLRPLSELQIGALFSKYTEYHPVFRSCNAGSKQGIWCCNCSKCLFTFTILSPFLKPENLVKIFGENLYEKESLLETFQQLTGNTQEKPFDCVGTIDEVNIAVQWAMKKYYTDGLPFLLKYYSENYQKDKNFTPPNLQIIDPHHFLKSPYLEAFEHEISTL